MLIKETNRNKIIYLACLLSGLVLFSVYFYSSAYTSQQLKNRQSSSYTSISFLAEDTSSDLDLKFKQGDNNPLDFSSKEVIPAASETSAANISYTPKTQKNTKAALIKQEAISKSFKLYLNTLNSNLCIIDFDNLAGFLIQKQLKTNA